MADGAVPEDPAPSQVTEAEEPGEGAVVDEGDALVGDGAVEAQREQAAGTEETDSTQGATTKTREGSG